MTSPLPDRLQNFRSDEAFTEWLTYLAGQDADRVEIDLPEGDRLTSELRALDVPDAAIPELVASRPDPHRYPEGWWILEHCVAALTDNIGVVAGMPAFPSLPADLPGVPKHLYIHVFVATLPHVRAWHRSLGIDEETSRAILADLGRNMRVHEKWHGEVGLGVTNWITLHFRGLIYDLGRLQFERAALGTVLADAMNDRGLVASPEELVLSLHIPDYKGPLTPEACDHAIGRARAFFPRHFPNEPHRFAVCHSWLLDPQLAEYLPPSSNIVQFQHRFELAGEGRDADRSIVQFVFGPVPDDPHDLPERTSLERAVKRHLVDGKHWHTRSGWFAWG